MIRAAGIMFLAGGKVLLCRRSDVGDCAGCWALPGGKIEEGETPEQAALRESDEELNFVPEGHLQFLMRTNNGEVEYTTFVMKLEGEFLPKLNEEHTAFAWVPPEEALSGIAPPPIPGPPSPNVPSPTIIGPVSDDAGKGGSRADKEPRGEESKMAARVVAADAGKPTSEAPKAGEWPGSNEPTVRGIEKRMAQLTDSVKRMGVSADRLADIAMDTHKREG